MLSKRKSKEWHFNSKLFLLPIGVILAVVILTLADDSNIVPSFDDRGISGRSVSVEIKPPADIIDRELEVTDLERYHQDLLKNLTARYNKLD